MQTKDKDMAKAAAKAERNAKLDRIAALSKQFPPEFLDQFMRKGERQPMTGEEVELAANYFRQALIERALGGEMDHHLSQDLAESEGESRGANKRNGKSSKTIKTGLGSLKIGVPRDRAGSFEPVLIRKHQRRFTAFDDQILGLYARGMTVRDIQSFLEDQYGTEVSPDLISKVTDAVVDEIHAWQNRPLESVYPVVFFDAIRVKIRESGVVSNKAVYLALGVLPNGTREIMGMWIEQTEGAKFWMKVFNEIKQRGVNDILIAVTDGLKGMGEALEEAFPQTTHQTCIVHLIRSSLAYASWKERKPLAEAIRPIYTAIDAQAAEEELNKFEQSPWGQKFPTVVRAWRQAWDKVIPFLAFHPEIRKVIYTMNAIESVNARIRKTIKTRGHFPSDEAAFKLIWLAIIQINENWGYAAPHWKKAMNQFAIAYGDRFTAAVE